MGNLFIGIEPEALSRCPQGWVWLKPTDGGIEIYALEDGTWGLQATISLASHSHPTHGDINFTGAVSVDSEAGITGARTIDGHTLTFKNGILVGYEAP